MLSGGDLRSIGRVPEVMRIVAENPERVSELVRELDGPDPVVRGRAADALEKLSARKPAILSPYKADILRLAKRSRQQEVRWHLAQMVPRLPLTRRQIRELSSLFRGYLRDRSVIVQVCALQAMFELALEDPTLSDPAKALLEAACRTGAPALRARGRKLLARFGEEADGL
jgi:hypothetical protein